ncbi:MAG: hypothetical protein M0036_00075 [Desulfobacteraceae bacterium]|nr:hypothetical protein [Desulfobacteraceae bacterium]
MNILIVTHDHRHGSSTYVLKTPLNLEELPDRDFLIKLLDIDFEEDREESISFELYGPAFIPTLTKDFELIND